MQILCSIKIMGNYVIFVYMKTSSFWFLAIITLLLQEQISTNSMLAVAYRDGRNLFILTLVLIIATTIDIFIGYKIDSLFKFFANKTKLSLWFKNNVYQTKIIQFAQGKIMRFENLLGKRGQKLSIFLVSCTLLPSYLVALLSSRLNIPMSRAFPFILLGNFLWYLFSMGISIGIFNLVRNVKLTIIIVATVSLGVVIVHKIIVRKLIKK